MPTFNRTNVELKQLKAVNITPPGGPFNRTNVELKRASDDFAVHD